MSGAPYPTYRQFLESRFGKPVRKLPVDAGFTCPNRDGTRGYTGCAFCDNAAFHPITRTPAPRPVAEQLQTQIEHLHRRGFNGAFLAYFQPFSNTYAPVDILKTHYREALAVPGVDGLVIGTRPDCVPAETADLLRNLANEVYLQLELGLQIANDTILAELNRNHTTAEFVEACKRVRGSNVILGAHMIIGLPGSTPADDLHTAETIAQSGCTLVKIHSFHLLKGSPLAAHADEVTLQLLTLDDYAPRAAAVIKALPSGTVIDRIHGSAPPEHLLAPAWAADGNAVREAVWRALEK